MKRFSQLTLALFVSASVVGVAKSSGPMDFEPIDGSVAIGSLSLDAPFKLPEGFTQKVLSDEKGINALDIYANAADWPDMNTTNETGKHAGRYLYRTHEVRPGSDLTVFEGGALSMIDLKTGESKLLAQRQDWEAMDGIVWTPWQTLLFGEETGDAKFADPEHPTAIRGLVYEVFFKKNDPTQVDKIVVRPQLGSIAHEGIEVDAEGNVYVIDEYSYGAIYKFVPDSYGDLSSGQLYALQVADPSKEGDAQWLPLDMHLAVNDARAAAASVNATSYCRPEDLERIGRKLYVALTCEHAVLSISLSGKTEAAYFVKAGVNAPVESAGVTGFAKPDNLAKGPDGNLWIVEDNKPSDIWVAEVDGDDKRAKSVKLFASLSTPGAEASGIYFGRNPGILFVNIQHSADNNDKTMMIMRPRRGHHDHDDEHHGRREHH